MVNALEVVGCFEETKAKGSKKWSVGIDEDINFLEWRRDASSILSLEGMYLFFEEIKFNFGGAKTKI